MPCKSCVSSNQKNQCGDEHLCSRAEKYRQAVVWVFPEIVVCLDCGTAEFAVPETELRLLAKGAAATG
jgi:hypothetical protein